MVWPTPPCCSATSPIRGPFRTPRGGQLGFLDSFVNLPGGTVTVGPGSSLSNTSLEPTSGYLQTGGVTTIDGELFVNRITLQGGVLSGSGTVPTILLTNGGTLGPGDAGSGSLTILGNYTQTSRGVLAINLDSPTAYDSLVVGGTTTLGGTLAISRDPGFAPVPGTSLRILTFGRLTAGSHFDHHTGLGLSPYQFLKSTTDTGGLNLTATLSQLAASVLPVSATAGWAGFQGTVATFTDTNPCDTEAMFTVTITWGDGSPPDSSVTVLGANGVFLIQASHVFRWSTIPFGSSLPISVTIQGRTDPSIVAVAPGKAVR